MSMRIYERIFLYMISHELWKCKQVLRYIYIYKDGLELTYKLIFSELIQRSIKVELGIIYMQLELILI
jgi:hypothetical protein